MRLASLRLTRVPPFGDVTLPFADEDGAPRSVTVLLGGGGVGKTSVVGAIASTRPGNTSALGPGGEAGPLAVASYILGRD
ncbi:MAG: hypothetical protein FJ104_09850, partial [Deltaproteobacteria bacterium]|nr:hypothetical protein [Deltaproteobacteria bacterium]